MKTFYKLVLIAAVAAFTSSAIAQSPCIFWLDAQCDMYYSGNTTGVANDNASSGAVFCVNPVGTAGQHWYLYQYPYYNPGPVTVSTDFPATFFDSQIHVYTGQCGSFSCIAGDDDSGSGATSTLTFTADYYGDYYIRVGGFGANTGLYGFQVTCPIPGCIDGTACNYDPSAQVNDGSCIVPWANDDFWTSQELYFNTPYYIDNRCTYWDYDLGSCNGSYLKDVWYFFYYTGGTIELGTYLGTYFTVPLDDSALLVYDYYNGNIVACNDDFMGFESRIVLDCTQLVAGQPYYVQVSGFHEDSGQFYFRADQYDISGCTDYTADNYDPCANVNDGHCDYGCGMADLNGDQAVNVTDLLLFTGAFGNTCY